MRDRPLHERFLEAIADERQRLASRRGFLVGSAKVAGGGALALAFAGTAGRGVSGVLAQDATPEAAADFEDDIDVLNYALTLEHLENAFYRDGLAGFTTEDFDEGVFDNLTLIGGHEAAHVDALTATITDLGGTPVEEAAYDFGDAFEDPDAFLETAAALENTGVSAYDGAAAAIQDVNLLAVAGQIVAVEARHASYLNLLTGEVPFPGSFEEPLSRDEVLEIAGDFIVSDGADGEETEDEATPEA